MMFSFYDQLIIYLCEIRDRVRLIPRLVTRSRGLAKLDTVWYQHSLPFENQGPIFLNCSPSLPLFKKRRRKNKKKTRVGARASGIRMKIYEPFITAHLTY